MLRASFTRKLEALKSLKPRNIKSEQQWQRFIKERVSAEFKMQERPNSPITRVDVWIRAHTKKDETVINEDVAEKLKKINEYQRTQVSEDASTIHGDALTHVLGKERNGRVRGAGSGVTATLMNLEALSKSHTAQNKMELKDLKKLFEELKAAFIKNTSKQADHNETSHKRKCLEDTSHAKKAKTCGSTFTNIENARCRLLDWMGTGKVVGEGTIASRDPLAKVHHICLGPDCWKVWVTIAMVEDTPFYRATSEFHVVSDAIGSTIAWPKNYILLE
ncbi:uncharacterized protein LOC107177059 isoform X2 [Citrus sinensis]|uniref:uncharacterized protein LOC107177059 isoform X2 n=1 Tax=Citrus sinensis TaxID=2711 RepID=UPI002277E858|nr:uncharacterized protein LOC107177059 isoform X2 [Citrus sinensis]